jgi:hypothetical protein
MHGTDDTCIHCQSEGLHGIVHSGDLDDNGSINIKMGFFRPHNFCIFLYVVYILHHVSAVRGHHQVFAYTLFTSTSLCFFAAPPTLANVYINGGVCPLVFVFHQ